jgi:hypothetical protein
MFVIIGDNVVVQGDCHRKNIVDCFAGKEGCKGMKGIIYNIVNVLVYVDFGDDHRCIMLMDKVEFDDDVLIDTITSFLKGYRDTHGNIE